MRKNNVIDRFCARHPHFGIPNLMRYVCIGNAVFWLLGMFNSAALDYLTFSPYYILHGQIWRLVSFIMYPPATGFLAFIAIYFYYMIGNVLEQNWGTCRFNVYFFMGVILTEIYGFLAYFIFGVSAPVTATYIYLSMFFCFAILFPDMQVLLFFIIPIKMKWLALIDLALFLYSMVTYIGYFVTTHYIAYLILGLLPLVAILNVLIFCSADLLRMLPRKKSRETINFKRESERIRHEQASQLYRHKCSVCGRTDKDYPNLEFRYCSKCQGYHCFCQDHINSHVHFTQ